MWHRACITADTLSNANMLRVQKFYPWLITAGFITFDILMGYRGPCDQSCHEPTILTHFIWWIVIMTSVRKFHRRMCAQFSLSFCILRTISSFKFVCIITFLVQILTHKVPNVCVLMYYRIHAQQPLTVRLLVCNTPLCI